MIDSRLNRLISREIEKLPRAKNNQVVNHARQLIRGFKDTTINIDSNLTLDMYDYFYDEDEVCAKFYSDSRISKSSLGENTLTFDCNFSCLSPENTGQLFFRASAKYGESFLFSLIASGNFSKNSEECTILIWELIMERNLSNSSSDNFVRDSSLLLWLLVSSNMNSGDIKLNFLSSSFFMNTSNAIPLTANAENTALKSTTKSIYFLLFSNAWYLLANERLISSDTLSACSCVSLDLDTIFSTSSHAFNLFSCLINSSLASSDQFTQGNFSINALNSSEIFNATLTIYNSLLCLISSNFSNCSALFLSLDLNTSGQLISGKESILSFNSFGIDNVNVGILAPPSVYEEIPKISDSLRNLLYKFLVSQKSLRFLKISVPPKVVFKQQIVNTQKDVGVFKSFENLLNFEDTKNALRFSASFGLHNMFENSQSSKGKKKK